MARYYIFVLVILAAFNIRIGSTQLTSGLELAFNIVGVVKFGEKLYQHFEENKKLDELDADIQRLKEEIENRIELSTSRIVNSVFVAFKLNRIEDIDVDVNSFLQDLKDIITSTGQDRGDLEKFFVERFSSSDLLENLRYLPELLTLEIPGSSGKLLDILTEQTRCNMTALYEFETFYFELFSSGIGIHVVFNRLKFNKTADETMNEWTPRINMAKYDFEDYEELCKNKFNQLVKEDINNGGINEPGEMKQILNERYPWKIHDVYFLRSLGTTQFLYFESKGGEMIWQKVSDVTRVIVSIDTPRLVDYVHHDIEGLGELDLKSTITSDHDSSAARHVGQGVKQLLDHYSNSTDIGVTSLISYFNETGNNGQVSFNKDSPVMKTSVKNVNLEYCHKSFLECIVDSEEARGDMIVFFYVYRHVDKSLPTVTGLASEGPAMCLMNILMLICVCYLM